VQRRVIRVPVEDQVKQPLVPEDPVQVTGLAQARFGGKRASRDIVMERPEPEPPVFPPLGEPGREPAELPCADLPVVISLAVAVGHPGVQPGHHHGQVLHLEQCPWLVRRERDAAGVRVEVAERVRVMLPLRPVRRGGLTARALFLQEVGLAGQPVHVMVARHDRYVLSRYLRLLGQRPDERGGLRELHRQRVLGEVPCHEEQVGP
jgi:hypothetical protein